MANEEIYLQLLLISLGIVLFSLFLNKILGITPESMKEIREKTLNLQERMGNAQVIGDMRLMRELQMETMQLMKLMAKKQIIPMCLRCVIFIGIWIVLSFFYNNYGPESGFFFGLGWIFYYFILALGLSFAFMGIRLAYRKRTGKQDNRSSFMKEMSEILNLGSIRPGSGTIYHMPSESTSPPPVIDNWKDRIKSDTAWKDRIQKTIEDVEKSAEDE